MSKTNVQLNFVIPTSSVSRIGDMAADIRAVLIKHKATDYHVQYNGPISLTDDTRGDNERSNLGRSGGRGEDRDAADAKARADFEDDATGDRGEAPAEPVKRGRGRPRKSDGGAEASGTPAGRSERGAEGGRGSGEGDRGHEPRGADQGTREGRGEGEGRARGAGADRGAEQRDPDPSRVKPPAQSWDDEEGPDANTEEGADWWCKTPGDEWPDHLMPKGKLDQAMLGEVLSQHFEQTGDRAATLAVLKEATGEGALKNVHPDDYDKAARALLKDAARIQYGVKR